MTARHATTARPCAPLEPLDGHPSPGEVLRAAASALPTTDPSGALIALAHRYDALDDTTDERLVRELATERGIPENLVRLSVGMKPIPPEPACSCELRLRSWNGGYGRTTTEPDPGCPVHGGEAA